MIETAPFGRTGHASTRILFGAAAVAAMQQDRADRILELLLEFGIDHLDTAASYGDSELRLAPWLRAHPGRFFVASKTGERDGRAAAASIRRSLERLGIDRLDLIRDRLRDGAPASACSPPAAPAPAPRRAPPTTATSPAPTT
jgi:aryl-alcohol dehydrogenase-like predicted oxidoreductase